MMPILTAPAATTTTSIPGPTDVGPRPQECTMRPRVKGPEIDRLYDPPLFTNSRILLFHTDLLSKRGDVARSK